jgi:hypothetical protein
MFFLTRSHRTIFFKQYIRITAFKHSSIQAFKGADIRLPLDCNEQDAQTCTIFEGDIH